MVVLDSVRPKTPVPALARWLLGQGIAATLVANVARCVITIVRRRVGLLAIFLRGILRILPRGDGPSLKDSGTQCARRLRIAAMISRAGAAMSAARLMVARSLSSFVRV
jgi:hypothetical protein